MIRLDKCSTWHPLVCGILLTLMPLSFATANDIDLDTDIDVDDLSLILGALNTPASGGADLRDANSDGTIDILDVRVAATGCTRPICAVGNNPPTFADQTHGVDENSSSGTAVGTLVATDPDGHSLSFSILSGNSSGAFAIDSSTGAITVANTAAVNFEVTPVFTLAVEAMDDGAPSLVTGASVTVNLIDRNDAPVISTSNTVSVPENAHWLHPSQTAVIDIETFDEEGDTEGAGLSYATTTSPDFGLLVVFATTGEVFFLAPPDFENPLDANGDNVYEIRVQVNDTGGLIDTLDLQVTVTDEPEP